MVVINVWNYIDGQLRLAGQQTVPSSALAGMKFSDRVGVNGTQLPASVLDQLNNIGLFGLVLVSIIQHRIHNSFI